MSAARHSVGQLLSLKGVKGNVFNMTQAITQADFRYLCWPYASAKAVTFVDDGSESQMSRDRSFAERLIQLLWYHYMLPWHHRYKSFKKRIKKAQRHPTKMPSFSKPAQFSTGKQVEIASLRVHLPQWTPLCLFDVRGSEDIERARYSNFDLRTNAEK